MGLISSKEQSARIRSPIEAHEIALEREARTFLEEEKIRKLRFFTEPIIFGLPRWAILSLVIIVSAVILTGILMAAYYWYYYVNLKI